MKTIQEQVAAFANDIINSLPDEDRGPLLKLGQDDLWVEVSHYIVFVHVNKHVIICYVCALQLVTFDYGMKDENPIDHMRFYVKDQPHKPVKVRKDQVGVKMFTQQKKLL